MEIITNPILNLLYEHRYIFSFLGALFEGTYIMILGGVLFKFGYLKFWAAMAVLISGYFINGLALYFLGRIGGHKILRKLSKRKSFTARLLEKLEEYLKKHSTKTLLIARITYGLGFPVFVMAGSFKINLKKFLIINLIGSIIWITGTFWLGYVFGLSYKALGIITKGITLGLGIALFIVTILISTLIVFWLRKLARTEFIRGLENHRFQILRKLGIFINKSFNNKNGKA